MALSLPGTSKTIADQFLRDVRLAAIDAGVASPPVHPGSDWDILAQAVARVAMVGVANIALSDDDLDITTASETALKAKRDELGLPEVAATGSSGKIVVGIAGATTIVNGSELVLPNGLRIAVVGTYINPADGDELDVSGIDTGAATNAAAGAVVRFVSPPVNVTEAATVSTGTPLTGGTDIETVERMRKRVLNAVRNRPAGGNWSHVREIALNALGSIQDCYVYPALGGPSSAQIVVTKGFDRVNRDFSREPTLSACATVRAAIQAELPTLQDVYVKPPVDEVIDVALLATLPESVLTGGNGTGWLDAAPWPALAALDLGSAQVTVSSGTSLTVDAQTAVAPVALQTHIAWWSPVDMQFHTALVVSSAGGAGAWVLTLDQPLTDSTGAGPTAGDWICPAARNSAAYASTWLDILESLGPGENTADAARTPRALRHPLATDEAPHSITADLYVEFTRRHLEMTSVTTSVASSTVPAIPAAVSTAPGIFVPRRFAIYKA